jgi:hypothetical protein
MTINSNYDDHEIFHDIDSCQEGKSRQNSDKVNDSKREIVEGVLLHKDEDDACQKTKSNEESDMVNNYNSEGDFVEGILLNQEDSSQTKAKKDSEETKSYTGDIVECTLVNDDDSAQTKAKKGSEEIKSCTKGKAKKPLGFGPPKPMQQNKGLKKGKQKKINIDPDLLKLFEKSDKHIVLDAFHEFILSSDAFSSESEFWDLYDYLSEKRDKWGDGNQSRDQ